MAAYNQPDPPSAANYFAEEGLGPPSHGIQSENISSAGTPTLHSSHGLGVSMQEPAVEAKDFTRPDQTPKPAHAQARGA